MSWLILWMIGTAWADGGYVVGPGDELSVRVYDEPDLSGSVVVAESCTVTLALIGPFEVCGKTTADLEDAIADRYRDDYLVHPTVAVHVEEFRSQRVDVMGSVERTGPIYLRGDTTLVEVISLAGGPSGENVVDVRVVSADGTASRYLLHELYSRSEPVPVKAGDRVFLAPGEVVYVEGQVQAAGAITMREGLTVTQVLALAGGPDEFAGLRRVIVLRADGQKLRVNVARIHLGKEDDVPVHANDHVIVPRGAF